MKAALILDTIGKIDGKPTHITANAEVLVIQCKENMALVKHTKGAFVTGIDNLTLTE